MVVCGYGTKGRSAVRAMLEKGAPAEDFVVVDPSPAMSPRRAGTAGRDRG